MSPDVDPDAPADRERDRLERFEARLADALCSVDPARGVRELALDAEFAGWIGAPVSDDGVRITALLVARLRFERLIHGSKLAGERFRADPRAFTEGFKRYHTSVAAEATTPWEEAAAYEAWSRR